MKDDDRISDFLKEHWRFLSLLYRSVEEGLAEARHHFDEKARQPDPWLFAHLVRVRISWNLQDHRGSELKFKALDLPLSGIEIRYGIYTVKVFKADDGVIPAPGRSRRRQEFYNRNLFGNDLDVFELPNWALIWDTDGSVQLVFPMEAAVPHKSGSQRMAIALPHPADVDWLDDQAPASEDSDLCEVSQQCDFAEDLDIASTEVD